MMYLDGLSAADTAEVVGISANAISAQISRIKSAFEQ
jgi:DNA-directed RNA polymerase specialized sigma24 family protein